MICRTGLCCISDYHFWNLVTCIFICKIMMIMNLQDPKKFRGKIWVMQSYVFICCYWWFSIGIIHENQSCDANQVIIDTLYDLYICNKFIDKMIYYISIHITYLLICLLWKKNRSFNLCVRVWEVVNQIAIMCCMIRSEKIFIMVVKNQNSWQFENQTRDIKQIFLQWKEWAHQNDFRSSTISY